MSQLIRAVEDLDLMILRRLFGDEDVRYDDGLGFFAHKNERITQGDYDEILCFEGSVPYLHKTLYRVEW